MRGYVLRRLLSLFPVFLGVTFLTFFLISLTPGDYLSSLKLRPDISKERIEKLRHDFGLDKPEHAGVCDRSFYFIGSRVHSW